VVGLRILFRKLNLVCLVEEHLAIAHLPVADHEHAQWGNLKNS